MHETIKVDADQNSFLYTNLKTKNYNVPVVWKNNLVVNTFDQFTLTKNDWTIEVLHFSFYAGAFSFKYLR